MPSLDDVQEQAIDWVLKTEHFQVSVATLNALKRWLNCNPSHHIAYLAALQDRQAIIARYGTFLIPIPPQTEPNSPPPIPPLPAGADAAATAMWWLKRVVVEPTAESDQAFEAWLRSDPRHRYLYYSVEVLWDAFLMYKHMHIRLNAPTEDVPELATLDMAGLRALAEQEAQLGRQIRREQEEHPIEWQTVASQEKPLWGHYFEDGSECTLNQHTTLRAYCSHLRREMELLRGEIYVDVFPDMFWPLGLRVNDICITTASASFGVCCDTDKRIKVYVELGCVCIRAPQAADGQEIRVYSSQVLYIEPGLHQVHTLKRSDLARLSEWAMPSP